MKNFKYPLAIEGTRDELEQLRIKIEELGYDNTGLPYGHDKILVTNLDGIVGKLGFLGSWAKSDYNRIVVSASNPDLVLALAAMTEGDEHTAGEWFVKIGSGDGTFTDGNLYKSIKPVTEMGAFICDNGKTNGYYTNPFNHFRKATKEEIIAHFSPKIFNGVTPTEPKTMEKKIIGYKLKDDCKQYEEAAASICYTGINSGKLSNNSFGNFTPNSEGAKLIQKAGVIDLWFEPVYEEKFKVGDYLYCLYYGAFNGKSNGKAGDVLRISSFENEMIYSQKVSFENGMIAASNGDLYTKYFRLATPEEIAKAQTKVITLGCKGGTFDVEVSKSRIWYGPEDASLNVATLREIVGMRRMIGKQYLFTPSHIDSGCKKQVPIQDWMRVLEAYDSLNK